MTGRVTQHRLASKVFFVLALLLFTVAADIAQKRTELKFGPTVLDTRIYDWSVNHRSPVATTLGRLVSYAVHPPTLFAVVIALIVGAVAFRSRVLAIVIAVSTSALALLSSSLTDSFAAARPDAGGFLIAVSGHAFPSRHAFMGTLIYGLVVMALLHSSIPNRLKVVTVAAGTTLILAIAVSRLYLGVHWLTDVLEGLSLALGWLLVIIGYLRLLERKERSS